MEILPRIVESHYYYLQFMRETSQNKSRRFQLYDYVRLSRRFHILNMFLDERRLARLTFYDKIDNLKIVSRSRSDLVLQDEIGLHYSVCNKKQMFW